MAGVSPLLSLCPSHREAVLPKLHLDEDYPCSLVGNWNTWYGEQDQAGEVPSPPAPLPPSPGLQHLSYLVAVHSLSTAAVSGVFLNAFLIGSLPCSNTCVGSPLEMLPLRWPMKLLPCPASGFISPHSPCLLCCPTQDFFQFFRSVVLPSSSTSSFMLFLRPEAVFLSCLLYLIHSSTHFLFWYRHHLLLEAPPDPLFLSWIKYLP